MKNLAVVLIICTLVFLGCQTHKQTPTQQRVIGPVHNVDIITQDAEMPEALQKPGEDADEELPLEERIRLGKQQDAEMSKELLEFFDGLPTTNYY